ncbi:4Fe-4S binding protein [candidate division KSB1 bacterium]|nr:4Fe-4S binding protein [candidate division KSB1 bacterium]NIR72298.1 4Fe-4S binding protein [candidate division KSB1 bacterium]NIS26690.1 4Fe-4S binding protein [candidate division KSB1 bacterium]NIT70326.1 4Fe-4S binding protein [candidate division KSB1 bacterium]NIU27305.1 4Fe-4S binding protein [candidate division KSB1 bacterium]
MKTGNAMILERQEHTSPAESVDEKLPIVCEGSVRRSKRKKEIARANHELEVRLFGKPFLRFANAQSLRYLVQVGFLLLTLWIGFEFVQFVNWAEAGGPGEPIARPQGVEAFLPISALISLKYWILTGVVNNIHPAGLVIFLSIVGISLVVRKAFCSWICPVGFVSESLALVGEKVFGRNLRVPRWLDYPMRSLKYLLLFFFLYTIFWGMNEVALKVFIYSPYNRVADIKMLKFFQGISPTALWTIFILAVLSIFVKHFWCRYLCPYGALLGLVGFLSPTKVTRNIPSCIDCELCTKACPAQIAVHKAKTVQSDECTSCLSCVDACPVADTLYLSVKKTRPLSPVRAAWAIVLILPLFMFLAKVTGNWYNAVSSQEYIHRVQEIHSPKYEHNRGQVPVEQDQFHQSGGD